MRLFELLLLLANLPILVWPLVSRQQRPFWLVWLSLTAVFLALIHLVLEGYRWQMVPAYLFTAAVAVWAVWQVTNGLSQRWQLVGSLLALLAYALVFALPALLPIPKLLPPTGPYAIGTVSYHLVDANRAETYTANPNDRREFMAQVWYPADASSNAPAAEYLDRIDIAGPLIARDLSLPPFLFDHVNLSQIAARKNAPFVAENGRFPVIIFSHGIRVGIRGQNTTQIQELVSHGYIVAAIDHTYGNLYSVFPDGRVTFFENEAIFGGDYANLPDANRLMGVWANDISYLLDEMAQWDIGIGVGGKLFNGRFDLNNIGIFGHSTGGGTTVQFCHQDGRCRAGIGLDSWLRPLADTIQTLPQPFMFMNTETWLNPENAAQGQALFSQINNASYLLHIVGTAHFDFTDLPLFSPLTPQLGLSGSINSRYSLGLMNNYILAFFNQYLKGIPSDLLAQAQSPYPEVRYQKHE